MLRIDIRRGVGNVISLDVQEIAQVLSQSKRGGQEVNENPTPHQPHSVSCGMAQSQCSIPARIFETIVATK
jgi:hypothetical protein